MTNERIIEAASAFKTDAKRLFEDAVAALIALAFRYSKFGVNFIWDSDPVLDRECNAILRDLSESLARKAKEKASAIIEEEGWEDWEDEALEAAEGEGENGILWRFDMAGSHLRELLEIWVALAFAEKMTPAYLKILVLRYINNPYASPLWSRLPAGLLKWGRGYQKDLIAQIVLIGQDSIVDAVRRAEWLDAMERGAAYWIWRRGSNYDCPECEENKGRVFPMDVPFDTLHARCMCWPEYHYEPFEI